MLKTTATFVVGILFVVHFIGHSAAVVDHQGKDGFSVITGLGGRKMAAHKLQRRSGELTATTTTITTASKNSGNVDSTKASKFDYNGKPQTKYLYQQGEITLLEPGAKMRTTAKSASSASASDIPILEPTKHSQVDEETRRLLEAEREIVSLMHKDYKGSGGRSMGRRKPPINNNEPQH